jgi:hypothetical protein
LLRFLKVVSIKVWLYCGMELSFPALDIVLNRFFWVSDFHGVWGGCIVEGMIRLWLVTWHLDLFICANSWPDWLQGLQRWILVRILVCPYSKLRKFLYFLWTASFASQYFSLRSNSLFVFFTLFLPYYQCLFVAGKAKDAGGQNERSSCNRAAE